MNLEKYINHSVVDLPVGVISYLAFDNKNIKKPINDKPFALTLKTFSKT